MIVSFKFDEFQKLIKDNDQLNLSTNRSNRYFKEVVQDDGSVYIGEWNNDLKEGKGILTFQDGSKYEGYFVNDLPKGKGRLIHTNGDIYEGEFQDYKPEGYGKLIKNNGFIYEG